MCVGNEELRTAARWENVRREMIQGGNIPESYAFLCTDPAQHLIMADTRCTVHDLDGLHDLDMICPSCMI